jgi:hypothetical protein
VFLTVAPQAKQQLDVCPWSNVNEGWFVQKSKQVPLSDIHCARHCAS